MWAWRVTSKRLEESSEAHRIHPHIHTLGLLNNYWHWPGNTCADCGINRNPLSRSPSIFHRLWSRYVGKTILQVNISICLHLNEWKIGIDRVSTPTYPYSQHDAEFTTQNFHREVLQDLFKSIFSIPLILLAILLSKWVNFATSCILYADMLYCVDISME